VRVASAQPQSRLDEKFDASPAAAGKDLFLRGREHLYCLTEKRDGAKRVCCRSCAVKSQLGGALFSLAFGWWGFP
jgi:hypothetical protein